MKRLVIALLFLISLMPLFSARAQSLLFWSGFEGPVTLGAPNTCWGNGCWQDLSGTDSATGFSWPPSIGGANGRHQLLASPYPNPPVNEGNIGAYMYNQLQAVTGRNGQPTQAFFSQITQSGCCGSGSQSSFNGATQSPLMLLPANDVPELYISQWMYLQPDLASKMGPRNWRELFEWKTVDTDYRIQFAVMSDDVGRLYFMTMGDSYVPTYRENWRVNNTSVPVPVGQWFKIEVYWKRSPGADGRIWTAVNGQVIADHWGSNVGASGSRIDRIMMSQLYSGSTYPIYQWLDDVQIWSSFPPAGTGAAWDNPPYAPH